MSRSTQSVLWLLRTRPHHINTSSLHGHSSLLRGSADVLLSPQLVQSDQGIFNCISCKDVFGFGAFRPRVPAAGLLSKDLEEPGPRCILYSYPGCFDEKRVWYQLLPLELLGDDTGQWIWGLQMVEDDAGMKHRCVNRLDLERPHVDGTDAGLRGSTSSDVRDAENTSHLDAPVPTVPSRADHSGRPASAAGDQRRHRSSLEGVTPEVLPPRPLLLSFYCVLSGKGPSGLRCPLATMRFRPHPAAGFLRTAAPLSLPGRGDDLQRPHGLRSHNCAPRGCC
ncbi:hypothetical protein CB1_000294017 [Camelus ferus]|nr:hypothetical protein CB1_000294017 [Camelus ferus]